jgi:adenylylsulfate reductase subunit A
MANFETVTVETDLLICGGGMAACGAAVEAAHWAKKHGVKVTLVDKAAMDRSGAVAMGLSAINQYVGLKERREHDEGLRGLRPQRPDGCHPRGSRGQHRPSRRRHRPPLREVGPADLEGRRRQLRPRGSLAADDQRRVLQGHRRRGREERPPTCERRDLRARLHHAPAHGRRQDAPARSASASARTSSTSSRPRPHVASMGGAVHVFKPRSSGEGLGRSWYPPFNSGASTYFTIQAGAEMTCQEVRFIPVRFKDAYGPVGAWFLLFKSQATNAKAATTCRTNAARAREVGAPTARSSRFPPTCATGS